MDGFDFRNPDYAAVFHTRMERLARIRADRSLLPGLRTYYRDHPAQFITDWGVTFDPKNVERGLPALVPFILFPRQAEWVDEVVAHWKAQRPLLTEKTRQMGFSWLSVATACTLCLHYDGMSIGFGSRKEEYVDRIGEPKSLFQKARIFMDNLPVELRGGWNIKTDAPHMRIMFPQTGSNIGGEAGSNIGRGNTTGLYFVDESAFLERPSLIEAALSQTTNCRLDISTPNGMGNPFAQKRFGGKIDVFTFHWRDDPRKDDAWYAKQKEELDPVTLAQEIDIDYAASVEGVLIPSKWVQSAIDAHIKLGFSPTGARTGSLDVADEGKDENAFVGRHGVVLDHAELWSGKGGDILETVQRAFRICDTHRYASIKYDADGLGAGVRGDARVINDARGRDRKIQVDAFRGSAGVFRPEAQDEPGRKNQDFFANCKAQSWWGLRQRFQRTHRAVEAAAVGAVGGFNPDDLISIPSMLPCRVKLVGELSQPTFTINMAGKIVVDKAPDGTKSPNLADAVMMEFATVQSPMQISAEALKRFGVR